MITAPVLFSTFLFGLLGGAHCFAMCGGVVGMLCGGLTPRTRIAAGSPVRYLLAYNTGRVSSYMMAGALTGLLGAFVDRITPIHAAQIGLRLVAGCLLVGAGLYLAGVWARFASIESMGGPLWRRLEPVARALLPVRNLGQAVGLGALWGWMPCGLVYAALGVALGTGSTLGGALVMGAFGLGTMPALLAMGTLARSFARFTRSTWTRRVAGLAIVVFGVVDVATASADAGWTSTKAPGVHACCARHHDQTEGRP